MARGPRATITPRRCLIAGAEEALLQVLTPENPASTNPANEIAKNLTGRDYISWSAISTFRTCPLKYKFRYIDGLPEESVSSALVFGTGIHTAVEQHYQAILSGDPKPDVDALLFSYRSSWLPHDPDAILFGGEERRVVPVDLLEKRAACFYRREVRAVFKEVQLHRSGTDHRKPGKAMRITKP